MNSQTIYFFYNFIIRYLLVLPVTIFYIIRIYKSEISWIPNVIFVGGMLLATLKQLSKEKFNTEFFDSPIDALWNRNLPNAKGLLLKKFNFNEKEISQVDFYGLTGVILGATVVTFAMSFFFEKSYKLENLVLPTSIFLGFGSLMVLIIYWPAWKNSQKEENKKLNKPYWYWFSYTMHLNRQLHTYNQSISAITKKNIWQTILLLIVSTAFFADWSLGSPLIHSYLSGSTANFQNNLFFLQTMEFLTFYFILGEALKFFYVDQLKADAAKFSETL